MKKYKWVAAVLVACVGTVAGYTAFAAGVTGRAVDGDIFFTIPEYDGTIKINNSRGTYQEEDGTLRRWIQVANGKDIASVWIDIEPPLFNATTSFSNIPCAARWEAQPLVAGVGTIIFHPNGSVGAVCRSL